MHDDVIKWKHLPRYWPYMRGIHRSPVNSPHKGQWHGALIFPFICDWINGDLAGDFRRHRAHYDIIVMGKTGTTKGKHSTHTNKSCNYMYTAWEVLYNALLNFLWRNSVCTGKTHQGGKGGKIKVLHETLRAICKLYVSTFRRTLTKSSLATFHFQWRFS